MDDMNRTTKVQGFAYKDHLNAHSFPPSLSPWCNTIRAELLEQQDNYGESSLAIGYVDSRQTGWVDKIEAFD